MPCLASPVLLPTQPSAGRSCPILCRSCYVCVPPAARVLLLSLAVGMTACTPLFVAYVNYNGMLWEVCANFLIGKLASAAGTTLFQMLLFGTNPAPSDESYIVSNVSIDLSDPSSWMVSGIGKPYTIQPAVGVTLG